MVRIDYWCSVAKTTSHATLAFAATHCMSFNELSDASQLGLWRWNVERVFGGSC